MIYKFILIRTQLPVYCTGNWRENALQSTTCRYIIVNIKFIIEIVRNKRARDRERVQKKNNSLGICRKMEKGFT